MKNLLSKQSLLSECKMCKSSKGIILIEVVVAIGILMIFFISTLTIYSSIMKINKKIKFEKNLAETFSNIYYYTVSNIDKVENVTTYYIFTEEGTLGGEVISPNLEDYDNYIKVSSTYEIYTFTMVYHKEPYPFPLYDKSYKIVLKIVPE